MEAEQHHGEAVTHWTEARGKGTTVARMELLPRRCRARGRLMATSQGLHGLSRDEFCMRGLVLQG